MQQKHFSPDKCFLLIIGFILMSTLRIPDHSSHGRLEPIVWTENSGPISLTSRDAAWNRLHGFYKILDKLQLWERASTRLGRRYPVWRPGLLRTSLSVTASSQANTQSHLLAFLVLISRRDQRQCSWEKANIYGLTQCKPTFLSDIELNVAGYYLGFGEKTTESWLLIVNRTQRQSVDRLVSRHNIETDGRARSQYGRSTHAQFVQNVLSVCLIDHSDLWPLTANT